MENQWNFLGTAFSRNKTHMKRRYLPISTTPKDFKDFISSASLETLYDIFNESVLLAILEVNEEVDSPEFRVKLSFDYTYFFHFDDGDMITMKPHNAASILNSEHFDCAVLQTLNPQVARLNLTPYYDFGHHQGVDIEIYYSWKQYQDMEGNNRKTLYLQMKQEPIPCVQLEVPFEFDDAWKLLGVQLLNKPMQMKNELRFERIESFLDSFPTGKMRERILGGYGVRVAHVYIDENQMLMMRGLQLKVKRVGNHPPSLVLVLSLGEVLRFRSDFRYKWIEVYYRWIGDNYLELAMNEKQ